MSINEWEAIPGANLPISTDKPEDDFSWLDAIDEDNSYMALDISRPYKTLDFGSDGYTGSVTTWHELLQLTAPDPECGVVFVRGDFPDSAESILARAQRRNQKGAFGLSVHIKEETGYVCELTPAQGMINLRWPCTRFNLVRSDTLFGAVNFASYTICSFVKDRTFYQIARITPSNVPSPTPSLVSSAPQNTAPRDITLEIDVGGRLRFGCCSSNRDQNAVGWPLTTFYDKYTVKEPGAETPPNALTCTGERHKRRLEIRLWVNRDPVKLKVHGCGQATSLGHTAYGCSPECPGEVAPHSIYPYTLTEGKTCTIVASFTLLQATTPTTLEPLRPIMSATAQDHLGVSEPSISAPYRLWSSVLGKAPGAQSCDLNIIGRSVEQILGVSATPVIEAATSELRSDTTPTSSRHGELNNASASSHGLALAPNARPSPEAPVGVERDLGVALLKNIITPQVVDLQSTFWQVRLLVKAFKLLDASPSLPAQVEGPKVTKEHYLAMHSHYKEHLLNQLRHIAKWVLGVVPFLQSWGLQNPQLGIMTTDVVTLAARQRGRRCEPSSVEIQNYTRTGQRSNETLRRQEHRLRSQRWYSALIIWYMLAQKPEIFTDSKTMGKLWNTLPAFFTIMNGDNDIGTASLDDSYTCILRWYYSHSLVEICRNLEQEEPGLLSKRSTTLTQHQKWANHWQIKAEKSLRLFDRGRLVRLGLGHEVANLAMLSEEIRIKNKPLGVQDRSCLSYAQELIRRRPDTTTVIAGRSNVRRWDPYDRRSAKPRPAPWELSCLGHHAPLSLGVAQNKAECKDDCKMFMLSDYTFISSWDQSLSDVVGQWWDFTTSSIVCARILDDLWLRRLNKRTSIAEDIESRSLPRAITFTGGEDSSASVKECQVLKYQEPPEHQKVDTARILEFLQKRWKMPEDLDNFLWRERQPAKLYHADSVIQSLEDTPEVFKLKQAKNITIRPNVQKYLKDNAIESNIWTLESVERDIPAASLRNISCIDFSLQVARDGNKAPEIRMKPMKGRINLEGCMEETTLSGPSQELLKWMGTQRDRGLWDLYFLGKPEKHPNFATLTDRFQELLSREDVRTQLLHSYQLSLLSILSDSMVDLGTKYRILFVKILPPNIVQAMIHMWHPDALDTFDDHLGVISHFFNIINQVHNGGDDIWTTSITISHWRLQDEYCSKIRKIEDDIEKQERRDRARGLKPAPERKRKAGRDDDDNLIVEFPPKSISDQRTKKPTRDDIRSHFSTIRPLSMSLVITGDKMGRNWTCSIVSELLSEHDVARYADEIKDIMQMFIHQQYTGRVLAFLLLLGYFCESLSKECESFTHELYHIMGMDPMVLLRGMEWHKSDVAVKKLKEMLWGLEALRVFDDKLKSALQEIKIAKTKMIEKELVRGKDLRDVDMKRDVEKVKEEFEKRYNRLENAHVSIQQRILQGTRLREGITSVLGVEQNENISMLTWVTIAYLPLAFIAGVFSMGHGIVPDDAGWHVFGWLLIVFLFGTIVFALSLQFILGGLRRAGKGIERAFTTRNKVLPVSVASSGSIYTFNTLNPLSQLRRRRRQNAQERDLEIADGAIDSINARSEDL